VAEIVRGKQVADGVSLDINPSSRQVLASLIEQGYLADLVASEPRSLDTIPAAEDLTAWTKYNTAWRNA